jgi:hypothetical protein
VLSRSEHQPREVNMADSDDDRIVKTASQARAEVTGHKVHTVLVASLLGAILLLIGIAAVTLH